MIEIWQNIVANYPFIQTILDTSIIIFPLAILTAYAGLIFISCIAKIISIAKNRPMFNKVSRQIALLALIFGWLLLIGIRVYIYLYPHSDGTVEKFLMETSWLLLSLGVLLTTVYYTLWRILKNMPVLHATLGMISAVQNCLAFLCIIFTLRLTSNTFLENKSSSTLPELFPETWNDPVWSALCFTIPLIFAYAGAFASCWIVTRRKHDDFGRDYYNLMLKWSTLWARNAWGILWLLFLIATCFQLWQNYDEGQTFESDLIADGSRVLLWLIPLLLWIFVCKAKIPMRNSWALFAALLIAMSFMLPYFLDITLI